MHQTFILCHQEKSLGLEIGYILLNHWLKESHVPHKISQATSKATGCSSKLGGKALLMTMTLVYVMQYEEVMLLPS